jgi:hypothetical protein
MKAPSLRPAIFLLLTLALSATTLLNIADGSESALDAGIHLVAAILIARLSVLMVGHLVDSYQANAAGRRAQHQAQRNEPR